MKGKTMTDTLSDTLTEHEIKQMRGPVLRFTGQLLAETSFEIKGRDALQIRCKIYETRGGALVAVSSSTLLDRDGFEDVRATVVPKQDDEFAMRCAVMDAFEWETRARRMVTRQLKWDLVRNVE
jgi:hypothetical protein